MPAGRPRSPLAKLEASGALQAAPHRYRDRKEPKLPPLGRPPAGLSKAEVAMWHEMASVGFWFSAADRYHLERAAVLMVKSRTKRGLDLKEDRFLLSVLKALCFGPSERHRIQTSDDGQAPQDQAKPFFN